MAETLVNSQDCCTPCVTPQTVNVPGPQGPAGTNGTNGTNGHNAFTNTTASFTMPAVSGNVIVAVADTSWMVVGQTVFVGTAGFFTVNLISSGISVTLTNTGVTGNAAPTTLINNNQGVSAGGVQGAAGAAGAVGATGPQGIQGPTGTTGATGNNAYTTTTAGFTIPPVFSTVFVNVVNALWATIGQVVFVQTAGWFKVANIPSSTQFSLLNLGYPGNAAVGAPIAFPETVSPAGLQGPSGIAQSNDYAVIKEDTTPATPVQNTWVKRLLSNIAIPPAGMWLTLGSNQLTLNPGSTYRLRASAPAANAGRHLIRLYNVGLAAVVTEGYGTLEAGFVAADTRSFLEVQFAAPAAPNNVFEIDHWVDGAGGTFGDTGGAPPHQTFAIVEIERVAGT